MTELIEILKDIASTYNLSEETLIAKYVTHNEDFESMPVSKLKEMIQKMGGDIKGKKKKQEWVQLAMDLLKGSSAKSIGEKEILCEVRKFGDKRCALHAESGKIFSIETHGEIGMWDAERGPVFYEIGKI